MYLFRLGREQELSRAELEAVFELYGWHVRVVVEQGPFFVVHITEDIDAAALMSRLGGVVKIGKRVCERDDTGTIADYLEQIQKEGKIIFSLSGNLDKRHGLAIKKELKQRGRSVRFVEANNTATILHNNLVAFQTDLTVVNHTVFATAAIQPIEAFVERDYGRPKSDTKSGMLPPKLSRILIHLSGIQPNQTMWDPFCGSGTILMEAAAMGFTHLLGSDNSQKAIDDAQKNMEWIVENEKKKKSFQLFVSDVRTAERFLKQGTVDAIISEPYLGKPLRGHEPRSFLEKQAEKLRQLYVAAFKTFFPVLKRHGVVLFIMPRFRLGDEWVRVNCVKDIARCGFSVQPFFPGKESLFYYRPGQKVGREIWRFAK